MGSAAWAQPLPEVLADPRSFTYSTLKLLHHSLPQFLPAYSRLQELLKEEELLEEEEDDEESEYETESEEEDPRWALCACEQTCGDRPSNSNGIRARMGSPWKAV